MRENTIASARRPSLLNRNDRSVPSARLGEPYGHIG
jgi:hypothetical protein